MSTAQPKETTSPTEALAKHGFSFGRMQGPERRGILYGDYDIQKWRNLSASDIKALHGVMEGDMRNGPVRVTLYDNTPEEALPAIIADGRGYHL